ncbi:MAG: SH3 domain-containing protein [Saprospiraceae bacterium]
MQPIKILSFICFVFFSFFVTAQDYQLNGRVSILNSRLDNGPIKYVKDVKISNELSPTRLTDYKGRFELNFIDHDPNSIINLKVEKEGYEVVNQDVLNDIQISKNPTIRIFLAKKGKVERKKKGLLKFSQTLISTRKDSIFHLLNLKAVLKDEVIGKLESNFGQKISDEMEAKLLLNQAIQDLQTELPDLIYQMASVNLDFASDRYKNATILFQKNQLERAIDLLDEKELDTSFKNILASLDKAKESPESQQKILNIRNIQIDNVIESFELRRTFLKLAFQNVAAEELSEKIVKMKTLIKIDQPTQISKNKDNEEEIVDEDPIVNILLEDTMQLVSQDTNWVELEMENLIAKGAQEEEMTGDPKANTILETSPRNSGSINLGVDFENTLVVEKDKKTDLIPIYEQPELVLSSARNLVNSSSSGQVKVDNEDVWLAVAKKVESGKEAVTPPASEPNKEVKKVIPKPEKIVIDEIIEPNYSSYKITKKTSLREQATASSKVLKRLKVGTEVKVIDQVDRYWSKVILDGKVGYVKVLLLEKSN